MRVPDKDRVLARLADRGVVGLNLWSVPHPSVPSDEFALEATWRAETVGLPVHQELTEADVARIADAAREALDGRA
jgi:hypothetical protein